MERKRLTALNKLPTGQTLSCQWIETDLGRLFAVSHETVLIDLEFAEGLDPKETYLAWYGPQFRMVEQETKPLVAIREELRAYFAGRLKRFHTPIGLHGSTFQILVWQKLLQIPYGQTCSYGELAASTSRPSACRAVGNANGKNSLAIVVPCHRVIKADGNLGGYAAGVKRKKWLLEHERRYSLEPFRDTSHQKMRPNAMHQKML